MLFLKILQYSRENPGEIFKNIYFKEHLCTAASELTLQSDCLELCFWIAFKSNITKIPVTFTPEL